MTADDHDERDAGAPDPAPVRPETDRLFLDVMLGKLAVYLRLCGYDTAYAGDRALETDDRILELAGEEDRTLLTRDVELSERASDAILLTERDIGSQLAELGEQSVELEAAEIPAYCGRCNGRLEAVSSGDSTPDYAPEPADRDCWRCLSCGQHFWKGSHYERMRATIE